ncbi:MAG: Cyclopropane-fatty-acyl-phospholipid synthase, partial [uncultured Ramlibacter sp.]
WRCAAWRWWTPRTCGPTTRARCGPGPTHWRRNCPKRSASSRPPATPAMPARCCAPTGCTWRAARCASSRAGSRCTRCWPAGRTGGWRAGRCAAHNPRTPSTAPIFIGTWTRTRP